jgi:hypothetical protein
LCKGLGYVLTNYRIVYGLPAFAGYIVKHIEVPNSLTATFTGFNQFDLGFHASSDIKIPLTITARLEPADIILYNPETQPAPVPAAHIRTTELKFHGGHKVAMSGQSLLVGETSEWMFLWRKLFLHDTFELGVKTRLKVHVGPLKTHVDIFRSFTFGGR